ncbi:MAG: hypothetical protein SGJ04_10455 [Bacteroidota bacterium]|nr:hypothetical protein [Bacteroidota bacterium]
MKARLYITFGVISLLMSIFISASQIFQVLNAHIHTGVALFLMLLSPILGFVITPIIALKYGNFTPFLVYYLGISVYILLRAKGRALQSL